jgi:hypothetical protein
MEIYDPATGTWSAGTEAPMPVDASSTVVDAGRAISRQGGGGNDIGHVAGLADGHGIEALVASGPAHSSGTSQRDIASAGTS